MAGLPDGLPARAQSPIQVVTGPSVRINYVDRSQRANHHTTPPPPMIMIVMIDNWILGDDTIALYPTLIGWSYSSEDNNRETDSTQTPAWLVL